tara:strand:+ start:887 stop:1030 length:144 start_codon:yes stop_codon:yes gene_type:complete
MARQFTNKLYDMVSVDMVMIMALKYMSEDNVKDMMERNGLLEDKLKG